jgi:hypothetical protein
MAYEQKNNSGSLFVNERKQQESHADYQGTALIEGVEYYVDGWRKEGKNGKKGWISFRVKPKGQQRQPTHHNNDFPN